MPIELNLFAGLVTALLTLAAPLSIRTRDRPLLAIVWYPSIFYLADELGAPRGYPTLVAWGLLGLIVTLIGFTVARRLRDVLSLRATLVTENSIKSFLLVAIVCLLVLLQYLPTHLLPDHDPIAVQAFAKAIAQNRSAFEPSFAQDDVFANYPPGYPILFSPVFLQFSGLDAAVIFKHLNLLIVALTPLVWATYMSRIFEGRLPGRLVILAWYVGFICLDRTIGYTQPIAGKNAMLLAGFLFPFVFLLFSQCQRSISHFVSASLALLGLFLVHYSAMYMVVICALVYMALHYAAPWKRPGPWLVHAASGVLALILFLPVILRYFAHPPEFSSMATASTSSALLSLVEFLFSPFSSVVFIFHDLEHILPWPFKNAVLILLLGWLLWIRRRYSWGKEGTRVLCMTGMFGGAWFLSLILAAGLIPRAGINTDYVSCFLFYFQAGVFAGAIQCSWIAWHEGHLRVRTPRLWLGLGISAAMLVAVLDFGSQFSLIVKRRYFQSHLEQLDQVLAPFQEESACFIVANSRPVDETGAHFIYGLNALDYVPVISDCKLVTGSWVSRPLSGGRSLGRLHSAMLSQLTAEGDVLFFGLDQQMRRYQQQVPGIRFRRLPSRVGPMSVWRVDGGPLTPDVPPSDRSS
jgi:hypothetical protein